MVVQNTLVELMHEPARTSITLAKDALTVMVWAGPVAVKLNHTSLATVAKPQVNKGGSDCEAVCTVPAVGEAQPVVTGMLMEKAQSSFNGGVGPGVKQRVNVVITG